MAQYWVRTARGETGPYSAQDLKRLAREGQLKPPDEISTDRTKWMWAAKVKGLEFGSAAAPAAPAREDAFAAIPTSPPADLPPPLSHPGGGISSLWDEVPATPVAAPAPMMVVPPTETTVGWRGLTGTVVAIGVLSLFGGCILSSCVGAVLQDRGGAELGSMVFLIMIAIAVAAIVCGVLGGATHVALKPVPGGSAVCTITRRMFAVPIKTQITNVRSSDFLRLSVVRTVPDDRQAMEAGLAWLLLGGLGSLLYIASRRNAESIVGTLTLETAEFRKGLVLWKDNVKDTCTDFRSAPEEVKRLHAMLTGTVNVKTLTEVSGM